MAQQGGYGNRRDNRGGGRGGRERDATPTIDTGGIDLKSISPELFDDVARRAARTVAGNRKSNKPTQLRKFYDEIVMWETKVAMHPDRFDDYLPFIRMLNAKVAYAKGRNNLVDENYVEMMNHCLRQVDSDRTMRVFKLFMEAFMGFYKLERPKD
ncbi:MAG: type III-A CRISPR-associated protein Csm2 [Pseudomonadota bacterium]|nr:type III-A CRISPR-associated protein Csm2 [Pseudomonadota bacterium]